MRQEKTMLMNANKHMTPIKCQQLLWNLLEAFEGKSDAIPAPVLVRELMQTERCEAVLQAQAAGNLHSLRQDYLHAMGTPVVRRIENYEQTPVDEEIALQAFVHYRSHTVNQLYAGLTPFRKLEYHTLLRAERNVAALGIFGVGIGGGRALYKTSKASWSSIKKHREAAAGIVRHRE
jgi:hypothetical protein